MRTWGFCMCKRLVSAGMLFCFCLMLLPAAQRSELESRQVTVGSGASITAGNAVHVANTSTQLVIAYQGAHGNILVSRAGPDGNYEVQAIQALHGASLQALAAKDSLVVVAYGLGGQVFTVTSNDGGASFAPPVPVSGAKQAASIQDMTIDAHGTVHVVFHRHDQYWDYNYARSSDGGKSYRTFLDFTKSTDSNSTGYSGNLIAAHGNLYTLYQDNNDEFAVKLGISTDGGDTWHINRLAPSTGGALALAVDPKDPDLVYVAAFNKAGLTVLRIPDATSTSVTPWPVHGDGNLRPDTNSVATVDIAVAEDGTVAVVYLNPITGSYGLLASEDRGDTWERGILTSLMNPTSFSWGADLLAFRNEFFFGRSDGKGLVLLHGPRFPDPTSAAASQRVFVPDSQGLVELTDTDAPFGVKLTAGMPFVMFSVPSDGEYEVRHLTQDSIPLYIALYDLYGSGDVVLAENYDGVILHDRLLWEMDASATYLLALGVLDDALLGETVRLEISQVSEPVLPVSTYMPATPKKKAAQVVAGYFGSFAISESGQLYGAGLNSYGQLADGTIEHKRSFVPLQSGVAEVSGGFGHTLFLTKDRNLYASGRNDDHQIGDGTRNNRSDLFLLADDVISAAAGYGHTLFVKSDGTVWGLGANAQGQLGDGTTTNRTYPVRIFEGGAQVFSNFSHTSFILTPSGDLYGFGGNTNGQLGLGHADQVAKPTYITDNVVKVAAGHNHTILLKTDGTVWSAGGNSLGQLGTGDQQATNRFLPVGSDIEDIASGQNHSLLIGRDGTLRIAGSNQYGQYGLGDTKNHSLPGGFVIVMEQVADACAGRDHTVVLKKDGTVWTAGLNEQFQLADQTQGFRREWKQVFTF